MSAFSGQHFFLPERKIRFHRFSFNPKELTKKLMTNLQLFSSISSQTAEARSDAVVSWSVTWKDPRSLRKGGRVSTAACLFFKKKIDNKEKETDARFGLFLLTRQSAQRRVMHNHTSRLLLERSGFIISHVKLAAKFSPTAVASHYDNSNSRLAGI